MTNRVPIRWRLTIWYTLLLMAILLLFAAGFYIGQRQLLIESLDTTLDAQAGLTFASLEAQNADISGNPVRLANPEAGDQLIFITDPSGQVVSSSGQEAGAGPVDPTAIAAANAGSKTLHWVTVNGQRMRVLSQPLRGTDGTIYGALQIGITDEEIEETLGITLTLIAILTPIALLLSGLTGYWVAGRALRPVDQITQLAGTIEAGDLARRISIQLPDDELGRLAQTFNHMLDRIETAFNRQRQFAADASHELRTPLTLMRSQLELALSQQRNSDIDQQTLEQLTNDVDRLTSIVAALLALTRGDAGEMQLDLETVDIANLIGLIAEQYQPLADDQGVRIQTDLDVIQIEADQDRLIQILINLIDNALRHSPEGSVVTIGCRPEAEGASIWVADEGTGIAEEHLPHVFERFYRVESGRDRASGGIGLGLSICKMIVDAHHGTIDIASSQNIGTTVTFWLPGRQEPPARAE